MTTYLPSKKPTKNVEQDMLGQIYKQCSPMDSYT